MVVKMYFWTFILFRGGK